MFFKMLVLYNEKCPWMNLIISINVFKTYNTYKKIDEIRKYVEVNTQNSSCNYFRALITLKLLIK